MMGANLVGFVIGLDGTRFFMEQLWSSCSPLLKVCSHFYLADFSSLRFLAVASMWCFVAAHPMLEYLEEERRWQVLKSNESKRTLSLFALDGEDCDWFGTHVSLLRPFDRVNSPKRSF
ncbi:hypothetical protein C8R43DRAFT_1006871 [Mycena crocata]|nr:hypothetical protein C8R43DRAFT_1006871 [Mycena crocata]